MGVAFLSFTWAIHGLTVLTPALEALSAYQVYPISILVPNGKSSSFGDIIPAILKIRGDLIFANLSALIF